MLKICSKSATVDFNVFSARNKKVIVSAGILAYMQKRISENSGYSIDLLRSELVREFGFKESTVDDAIDYLVCNGFVKPCEDSVQNTLTNEPEVSRIKSKPVQESISQAQPEKINSNNNYYLSISSFHPDSPLLEIRELIINWWNNYKGGVKSSRSWLLQRGEFRKIYEDKSVKHDIEAISMSIENAIRSRENSKTGKAWQAITYEQWVTYSKEKWIQYKSVKDKTNKSGNGSLVISDSGAWLGQLKIPAQPSGPSGGNS
jgi:hypothetical protein